MTTSNSVNPLTKVIPTPDGKEYIVERLTENSTDAGTLLSPLLIEEDKEVA